MKPFDLEAAMRGEPIITRDGRSARFIGYVPEADPSCRLVIFIEGNVAPSSLWENGQLTRGQDNNTDLFMAPKKHTLWVPLFHNGAVYWVGNSTYSSEAQVPTDSSGRGRFIKAISFEIEK